MLANRLSENGNISVLLIEAGEQFGPVSTVPVLAVAMQKSQNDWSFQSVPQQYSSKGMHDQVFVNSKSLFCATYLEIINPRKDTN